MTYEEAKQWLAGRGPSDGWTAKDVEAQEIVCAVEGIPEPESLRALREVYAQAVAKVFRPTFRERVVGSVQAAARVDLMQREVLDEVVRTVTLDGAKIVEERIRILLRPKPRWMPERLWRSLVKRLLVIERTAPS